MSEFTGRAATYRQTIRKALDWLASQQGADSAFGLPDKVGANPSMVTALAYLWGGMPWRCQGIMDRVRATFILEDGSLDRPDYDNKITDRLQYPYAPSWVIRSAAACGAIDIVHQSVTHLFPLQDEESGGMFGTQDEGEAEEGVIDMASTGMAGLAFLAAGHFDRARAAAEYIVNWLQEQPTPQERLLPQRHTETGLLDEESGKDLPANSNAPLVLDHTAEHSGYWLSGILVAFLTEAYQVIGEPPFLKAACDIADFTARSPILGEVCTAHKFAWGATQLYSVTQDPRHLEAACRVCDHLVTAQHPEGYFVYLDFFGMDDDLSQEVKVGVTSQYAAWMSHAAMHLPLG